MSPRVQYQTITSDRQLADYCAKLASAKVIAFDTEFVSEDSYRPDLCLIQVAADGELAIIDTCAVKDATPFWEVLASPGHESLAHAAREEFRFCKHAVGRRPHNLFDIQLAAGLIGLEYPASYGTLVSRLAGKSLAKVETRSDWRRRPLTERQLEYALQDVLYLQEIRDKLYQRLEELGRIEWFTEEIETWQQGVEQADAEDRWWRVSGISGLSARNLAIVKELFLWRDQEAERRNSPPRRILRDDLIIELARRASSDPQRIKSIRGFQRRDLDRLMPSICQAIDRALNTPKDQLPDARRRRPQQQFTLLGQFLWTALGSACRAAEVAPSLVGTVQDVRDLIGHQLGLEQDDSLRLTQGWRRDVLGQVINDLLSGKLGIRIGDPLSEQPLELTELNVASPPRSA